ncbi:MAG TPA: hypothetical protein VL443_19075 [Cyclobacteriaceae bacterium]|jgi:hypothetical protein|nr:hypothetical protein [Cyclobacteriaceae bacterium]
MEWYWYILITIALGVVLWMGIYIIYTRSTIYVYSKYIDLNKIKPDSPILKRMARIYFVRYQSYEISAYIILGISVVILSLSIYSFLFINDIIPPIKTIQNPSEEFILATTISIRTGIILVVFFITRVLLKLYSYLLQVSGFYISRFDAILWKLNDDGVDIEQALKFTTPEISPVRTPQSPKFDDLLEILKENFKKK